MKKLAFTLLLFTLPIGIAGAASVNGDYEGHPIVKVQSEGKTLETGDVPAVIYNGRTVVPIALLRQLGADVSWDADTYAVNVTFPVTGMADSGSDKISSERDQLMSAYMWLKDTDQALLSFTQLLRQYEQMPNETVYAKQLDDDYQQLSNQYLTSLQMMLKVSERLQSYEHLRTITQSESDVLSKADQARQLLSMKLSATTTMPNFNEAFHLVMLNLIRSAQMNIDQTNGFIHELQAEELKVSSTNSPSA